jgi:uncharacterized membrane protein YhaH (DUF805 family)
MLGAIKHGVTNLVNFSGRDARQTFWYYVLFVMILRFVSSLVIAIPMMVGAFGSAIDSAKAGQNPEAMRAQMFEKMAGSMDSMMWLGIAIGVVTGLLLCASIARRLQDSDLSPLWVLLPGALFVGSLVQMPAQMDIAKKMMAEMATKPQVNPYAAMGAQSGYTLLAWVPVLLVIYFGVRKSTPGPNRYGAEPVSF